MTLVSIQLLLDEKILRRNIYIFENIDNHQVYQLFNIYISHPHIYIDNTLHLSPKCNLRPGHGDLLDVLRQLDLRLPVDLHQLVDTAECGLSLTGDQVSADTETCDLVALLVQREDRLLVNIIGGRDHHRLEPLQLVLLPYPLHGLLHHPAEVGQVAGVNADSDWFVAVVMEGHRHGTEVE